MKVVFFFFFFFEAFRSTVRSLGGDLFSSSKNQRF